MTFLLAALVFIRRGVGGECSAGSEEVGLLQLRSHVEASRQSQETQESSTRPARTMATIMGKAKWRLLLEANRDPKWLEYPSSLAEVLNTMVITRVEAQRRWGYPNSNAPLVPGAGLVPPVPALFKKFDCVRHPLFNKTTSECKTLMCDSKERYIDLCLREIGDGTLNVASGNFCAVFGSDHRLSLCRSKVRSLGSHFRKIYYEAYDVMDDEIDVLPEGLTEYYLRFQDYSDIAPLSQRSSFPTELKVLGAFGSFWNISHPSRTSASELCDSHGHEAWLHCGEVPKEDWWKTLSTYSFVLNPTGWGVQSTKLYEALLMRAIPICTRDATAYVKLEEKGWPILLVNDYAEVARLNLTQTYRRLRKRLMVAHKYLFKDNYFTYLDRGHF